MDAVSGGPAPQETPPIGDIFGRLIEDADRVVRTELRLHRARLFDRLAQSRGALAMLIVGGVIGQAALGAMLVGLILTLSPRLGAGIATLVVVGVTVLIAGLLFWIGARRLSAAIKGSDV